MIYSTCCFLECIISYHSVDGFFLKALKEWGWRGGNDRGGGGGEERGRSKS